MALKPRAFILGHTYENLEVAPKIACRMGSDLITDSTLVSIDGATGRLLCTKQVYGGNAIAVYELTGQPGVVTVRPGACEPATPREEKAEILRFDVDMESSMALSETISVIEEEAVNLGAAKVIVSGGRGASNPEGIGQLTKLADLLQNRFEKVEIGGSRPLVDAGLIPRSRQVGQTGERVAPWLYLAIGISGATQHLSGMLGSKRIIAINKNPEAPIFKAADYGVVGLLEEVIPGFIQGLEEFA